MEVLSINEMKESGGKVLAGTPKKVRTKRARLPMFKAMTSSYTFSICIQAIMNPIFLSRSSNIGRGVQ